MLIPFIILGATAINVLGFLRSYSEEKRQALPGSGGGTPPWLLPGAAPEWRIVRDYATDDFWGLKGISDANWAGAIGSAYEVAVENKTTGQRELVTAKLVRQGLNGAHIGVLHYEKPGLNHAFPDAPKNHYIQRFNWMPSEGEEVALFRQDVRRIFDNTGKPIN